MESGLSGIGGSGSVRPAAAPKATPSPAVTRREFEAADANGDGVLTRDEVLQRQPSASTIGRDLSALDGAMQRVGHSQGGVTSLTEDEFARLLADDGAGYRFAKPEPDDAKTWGDSSFTRPLNYGHESVDGSTVAIHPSGVPVWADNGKAISADQWANMPKFQQDKILAMLPGDRVAEFQQAMAKGEAGHARVEPPEDMKPAIERERAWGQKLEAAISKYHDLSARYDDLVKTHGVDKILADPVPAPVDPKMMTFHPNSDAPGRVFFNHRESLFPHQLTSDWREIQRLPEGLKLGAAGPNTYNVGAEHQNLGDYPAELGVRFANNGTEPITLELSDLQYKDQPYGEGQSTMLATDMKEGKRTITIPPGESVNVPVLSVEPPKIGAYDFKAEVVSGSKADLAVKEIARFDKPAEPGEVPVDPWQSEALEGKLPQLTIFNDPEKGRTGLPDMLKTHQEFAGPTEVVSDVMAVPKGSSFKVDAYNYAPPSSDDFAGRDRGYAYHVDHVARFQLPETPKAFTFSGDGVFPQLNQERLKDAEGNPVTLESGKPFTMTLEDMMAHQPPLVTKTGEGPDAVYELRVSIPNGSNGLLEIKPEY
ncbi:MAG TPA: hypothetical protein V6D05_04895 [Stenomitos sp.]